MFGRMSIERVGGPRLRAFRLVRRSTTISSRTSKPATAGSQVSGSPSTMTTYSIPSTTLMSDGDFRPTSETPKTRNPAGTVSCSRSKSTSGSTRLFKVMSMYSPRLASATGRADEKATLGCGWNPCE